MLSGHVGTLNGVIYVIGMPKKPEHELTPLPQKDVSFIEPMECLAVSNLPDAAHWIWKIKIDGYRALAVKSDDNVNLLTLLAKQVGGKY